MKRIPSRLVVALACSCGLAAAQPAQDASPSSAQQIVSRAFANMYGFHSFQRFVIRARTGDGEPFLRTGQAIRRGVGGSTLNSSIVRLLSPEDVRGMGLLLIEKPDYSYDAFLYQPAFRRVRRITLAQRQQSFFGTDIAFEDLEAKRAVQWPSRLLREDRVEGRQTWVIEMVPKDGVSDYERIVGWFDQKLPVILRAEFYRGGERIKRLEIDPSRIAEVGGHHIPMLQRFRGKRGTVTEFTISQIEIREEFPDKLFTARALESGEDRWAR